MKLYTKRGDDGMTDLFGGQRVAKDDARVQAYGTLDELNSAIGLAVVACEDESMRERLLGMQSRLFELGADLATPTRPGAPAMTRIEASDVAEIEAAIDAASEKLPPMNYFVLPGGTELAARLHMARTIARRAERGCVTLLHQTPGYEQAAIFLNRISDLLFAYARLANVNAGVDDVPWMSREQ